MENERSGRGKRKAKVGVFYYENGDRYDGDWEGDKKNGNGKARSEGRNLLLCRWEQV